MPTDHATRPERSYGVWRAYGEVIIVEGPEPVWEEPGRQAQVLGQIFAPDYETACRIYEESIQHALNPHDEHLCRNLGLDPAELTQESEESNGN